jgi:hypothetical protein
MIAQRKWIVPTVTTLSLTMAVAVWAHGFGGPGGPGGPGPRHGGPGSGLVERLIDPCGSSCFDKGRTCFGAADAAALNCSQQTCDAAIQSARAACDADRSAQACKDGRKALRGCIDPCVQTLHTQLGSCHASVGSCRDACESAQ